MKIADLDGRDIAYIDEGSGPVILFIHGFASSARINWQSTGWIRAATDAGFRAIAADNRGHGKSTKFYEESDYKLDHMAGDAAALLDFLDIEQANVMGYSMGSRISAVFAHGVGKDRVKRLVLSGNGYNMITGGFDSVRIRDALLSSTPEDIEDPIGRSFRVFAEQTGSDLKALAACIMGARTTFEQSVFQSIAHETLVAVGTEDDVALEGDRLAELMPNARYFPIEGRNHMNAVGDRNHIRAVMEFLSR